jgi:hypothetical protein
MNDYAVLAYHYQEKIIQKKLKDTNNAMQSKMRRTLNNPLEIFEIKMLKKTSQR